MNTTILKKSIGFIVTSAILVILACVLRANWEQIRDYHFQFAYDQLAISFVLFVVAFFMPAFGWGLILKNLGVHLPPKDLVRIWFYSQLTRWLPGKVWSVLSMLYLTKGIPKSTTVLSSVLALIFNMLSGILTVVVFIHWWPGQALAEVRGYSFIPSVLLIAGLFIYPQVLNRIYHNRFSRYCITKLGKEKWLQDVPEYNLGRKSILMILLYFFAVWVISGVAFYYFVNSVHPLSLGAMPACILISALSWVISFLAFVTPGGLGVKESVTTLMLTYFLPVGVALVISFALRIWMIISELFCVAIVRLFGEDRSATSLPETAS
ncbi:MAG: lysylphosphatidylglycerol synthase domain-containing protein [bacterium]